MVMHARKPQRMNDGKPAEPVNITQGRWGKQRTIMYTQQIRNPRKKLNLQYRSQSVPSRIGETATIAGGGVLVTHRAKSDVEDISSDDSSPGDKDDYVCNFRKTAGDNEIEEAEPVRVLDYRTRVPRHHRVRPIEPTIRDTSPEVKYLLKTQKLIKHKQKQDHSHAKGICLFRYKNQRRMSIWNTQECSDKNVHSRRTPPCLKSSRTNTRNHNSKRKRNRSPENSCILDDGNRHMQLGVIFRRPSFVPDNWIHPCDPRLENSVSNEQNRPPIVYLVPQWNDMLKPSSPNFEKNLLPLPPRKAAADQTPKCKVNSPLKSQTKLNSSSQIKVKNTTNAELLELTTLPKLTSATSTKQQYEIIATTLNKQQTSFAGTNAIVVNSALKTTIFGKLNQTPEHSDQIVSKHNCKAATTLGLLSKTLLTEHEKSIMDSVDVNLMFDDASGDEQCVFANEDHSDYNNVDQFAFHTKTENLETNENTRIFQASFDLNVSRCSDDPIEVLANDCLETDIKEKLESYCSIESSTLSVANTALEQQEGQDDLSNKMTDRKTSSTKIPTSKFKNSYESVHKNVNNDDNAQFNHLETNFVNTNKSDLDYNNTHGPVSCRAGPNEMKQETKQSSKHDSDKSPVHSRKKSHKKRKKERRKKVTKNKTLKTPKTKKTASLPESELVAYIENTLEYNNMLEDVTKQITAEHVQNANETTQRSPDINESQTIKTFEISPSIEKSEKSQKTEKEILNDSPGHNINADSPLSDSTTLSDESLNARVLNLFELFNKYPQAIEQPVKCTRTFLSLSDLTTCIESRLQKNRNCEISSTPTQDMFSNKFQKTYNCSKLTNYYDFRQKINQANNEPLEYANDIKRVLSTRPVALQLRHSLSSGNDAILECNDVFKCNNVAVDLRYFEKHQSHSYQ